MPVAVAARDKMKKIRSLRPQYLQKTSAKVMMKNIK